MKKTHKLHFRYISVLTFFVLVCFIFLARVIYLQVTAPEQQIDASLNVRTVRVDAMRGEIYDRNGNKLVSNSYSYNVYLDGGSFSSSNESINKSLIKLLSLLPNEPESMLMIEGDYPNFNYIETAADSTEQKALNKMLDRFSLKRDTTCQNLVDYLLERYGITNNKGKLTVNKEDVLPLLKIRYEMDRLDFGARNPYTVAENIDKSTLTSVKELNVKGICIEKCAERVYNYKGYASHILGRTGKIPSAELESYIEQGYSMDAIVGVDGAEKAFEQYLRGTDGTLVIVEDADGNIVDEYYKTEPIAGKDVYLTLDIELQICAEDALAYNVQYIKEKADKEILEKTEKYTDINGNLLPNANIPQYIGEDVSSGAATVVNPNNGEVYALASYPTYDLSTFSSEYNTLLEAPNNPLYNRALMGTYEPGSTFKIGIAAAALEYGIIDRNTTIFDSGVYKFYKDFQPQCWIYTSYHYGHGNMNVVSAIQHSCNYFFYETGRLLTIEKMNEYTKSLGLGEYTGIELPESKGILAGPDYSSSINKTWVPGDTVQAAIGQSDNTFTPLQISSYLSTIINGGKRYQSHILLCVKDFGTNETIYTQSPNVLNTAQLSEENLNTLKIGMKNVMENGTAAPVFASYPLDIGGKTGTAQVGKTKSNNGIFTAFAPYENPEIVATCVIEQAGGSNDVGVTLKRIFNQYFNLD